MLQKSTGLGIFPPHLIAKKDLILDELVAQLALVLINKIGCDGDAKGLILQQATL